MDLPDILVTPEWLLDALGPDLRPPAGLVIADVRWKPDGSVAGAFRQGHLPGAVSIDVDTDLSRPAFQGPGRHPLPSPEAFARSMSEAGIGDDDAVIVYDDAGGSLAARLWWMLEVTDHRAALLDLVSLDAWTASGGTLETDVAAPRRAMFSPRPWPAERIVDADELRAASIDGAVVLDARAGERYRGEVEPIDHTPGHIPGAVNAEWTENRDPATGRFRSAEALRERYRRLGVDRGSDVIASCGSGVTACMTIFSLARAGLAGGRLYEGSWSDWSHDPARPVATGADPGAIPA